MVAVRMLVNGLRQPCAGGQPAFDCLTSCVTGQRRIINHRDVTERSFDLRDGYVIAEGDFLRRQGRRVDHNAMASPAKGTRHRDVDDRRHRRPKPVNGKCAVVANRAVWASPERGRDQVPESVHREAVEPVDAVRHPFEIPSGSVMAEQAARDTRFKRLGSGEVAALGLRYPVERVDALVLHECYITCNIGVWQGGSTDGGSADVHDAVATSASDPPAAETTRTRVFGMER